MKIIFPMAGRGSRFVQAVACNPDYAKPKPLIPVRGLPMIRWASGSLPCIVHPGGRQENAMPMVVQPSDLIFIILRAHDIEYDLANELRRIYSDTITVITINAVTRGAAETAASARPYIDPGEEMIVSDSDHFFDGRPLIEAIASRSPDVTGLIPVFDPPNDGIPRWSYSLTHATSNQIMRVAEKDADLMRRGASANIGAYYFSAADYFFTEAEEAIREQALTGGEGKREFYIAPIYQRLIDRGFRINAVPTPHVWGLGTPSDLEAFLARSTIREPHTSHINHTADAVGV